MKNGKYKRKTLSSTSPHCPNCSVRMVREGEVRRCWVCGRRFSYQVESYCGEYPIVRLREMLKSVSATRCDKQRKQII